MDVRSCITLAGFMTISLSSAISTHNSFANVSAETNSEDRFWINRSHQNLAKVDNYQAVIEQSLSNKTTTLISKVSFQKPNSFYLSVSAPDIVKGFEASYHNNTITLHDSHNKHVLTVKGLAPYKESSSLDRVKGIYMYNREHYEQEFTPSIHVAKRLSVGIDFEAINEKSEIKKVEAFVDYHHSLIMQSSLIFNNGLISKTKFNSMEFNTEQLTIPEIQYPKNVQTTFWDFSKNSISKKNIEKKINNNIVWPNDENDLWGFTEHNFYQQDNNKNNAAAYYHSDNYFLITLIKKNNLNAESPNSSSNLGAPIVIGNTSATLRQYPTFAQLEYSHEGSQYTLLSDIHPQGLLNLAKAMISTEE